MEASKKKQILVCDDDPMARSFTVRVLRSGAQYEVTEAAMGDRAQELILQRGSGPDPFELVLMDWNMPGMSGPEVLSQIKAMPQFKDLPFIMTSAESDSEKILEVLEQGARDYLKKPFEAAALLKKVERVLGHLV
jgi:two-component system chemotaxis response regulator CheY